MATFSYGGDVLGFYSLADSYFLDRPEKLENPCYQSDNSEPEFYPGKSQAVSFAYISYEKAVRVFPSLARYSGSEVLMCPVVLVRGGSDVDVNSTFNIFESMEFIPGFTNTPDFSSIEVLKNEVNSKQHKAVKEIQNLFLALEGLYETTFSILGDFEVANTPTFNIQPCRIDKMLPKEMKEQQFQRFLGSARELANVDNLDSKLVGKSYLLAKFVLGRKILLRRFKKIF